MTDSRTLSTTAQVTTCILSLYTGFGRIFTIQDLWSTNKDPSTKLERPRRAKSDYSRVSNRFWQSAGAAYERNAVS